MHLAFWRKKAAQEPTPINSFPSLRETGKRMNATVTSTGTFANPSPDLLAALRGDSLSTNLESVATVFGCVRVIADAMAMLPLKLYQEGDEKKQRPDHRIAKLLKFPNAEMTSYDFRRAMAANQVLHGFAIAVIDRNALGQPIRLTPIPSARVKIERVKLRAADGSLTGGPLIFKVTTDTGTVELKWENVLHLRGGVTLDGIRSIAASTGASNAIQLAQTIDEQTLTFHQNGGAPGMAFTTEFDLNENQRAALRDTIERRMQDSIRGKYRPLLLGPKMGVIKLDTHQAEKSQDVRQEQNLEICRAFGVPPSKVGISVGAYADPEAAAIDFDSNVIASIARNWEECFAGVLLQEDRNAYYFKHQFGSLVRAKLTERNAAYAVARQNGWMSANDIRSLEDLPPIEGGDRYLEPLNMKEAGDGATGNPGTQTTRQTRLPMNRIETLFSAMNYVAGHTPQASALPQTIPTNIAAVFAKKPHLASIAERETKVSDLWSAAIRIKAEAPPSNEYRIDKSIGESYWDPNGITGANVRKWLDEQSGDVTIRVNSPGGDVFEGLAIHNIVKEYGTKHKVTVKVDALAASAASIVMMAGTDIEIASNAIVMLHEAWSFTVGNKQDLRREADVLEKIDSSIVTSYAAANRKGTTADEIKALVEATTWFTAEEALEKGFCDRVGPAIPVEEPEPPQASITPPNEKPKHIDDEVAKSILANSQKKRAAYEQTLTQTKPNQKKP